MKTFEYLLKLKNGVTQIYFRRSCLPGRNLYNHPSSIPINSRARHSQYSSRSPSCCSSSSSSSSSSSVYAKGSIFAPLKYELSFFASASSRSFCTSNSPQEAKESDEDEAFPYDIEKGEGIIADDEWEEEDDTEPQIGDGGDGGGVVLQNVPWGERVLSIAHGVVAQFGDDMKLFAFKASPRGYIYVRLDKLSNEYGCPGIEEIESFSREYKKRLEEEGSRGVIPDDIALDVSSPGAERLLRVPDDLHRFNDFPMVVTYVEDCKTTAKPLEKSGVFFLDSIEAESEHCTWKLADVKENRDPASKGRPISRKQKDWRLILPYDMIKKVTFYLEF